MGGKEMRLSVEGPHAKAQSRKGRRGELKVVDVQDFAVDLSTSLPLLSLCAFAPLRGDLPG
jgi:hypothetical protein